ncbi:glycosyltransferase family 2 protein, partial [Aeromonas veronii]
MISIVILNYNSTEYTINCINSIFNSSYDNYEVIVVDNGSNVEQYCKLSEFI